MIELPSAARRWPRDSAPLIRRPTGHFYFAGDRTFLLCFDILLGNATTVPAGERQVRAGIAGHANVALVLRRPLRFGRLGRRRHRVEKGLGFRHISRREAFGQSPVRIRQQASGLFRSPLLEPQAGRSHGRLQLQHPGVSFPGDLQGSLDGALGGGGVVR